MTERFSLSSEIKKYQPLIYFFLSLFFLFTIYFFSGEAPKIYNIFSVIPTANSEIENYINNNSPFYHFGPEKYLFFLLNYFVIAFFGYTITRSFFDSLDKELFIIKITAAFGFGYICTIGILRPLTLIVQYNQIYFPMIGLIGLIILNGLRKRHVSFREIAKGEGKILYLIFPIFFFSALLLQIYQGDFMFVGHGTPQYAFNLMNWHSSQDHFPLINQHYDELIFHYFLTTPLTINFDPILPIWLTLAGVKVSTLAFLYLAFKKLKLSHWFSILASTFMMLGTVSIFPDKYYSLFDSSNPLFYTVHIARIVWLPFVIYLFFAFLEKKGSTYMSPLFFILAPIGISSIVLTTGIWILLFIVFWYFHKNNKPITNQKALTFQKIFQHTYHNLTFFTIAASIICMIMLFSEISVQHKNYFMILYVFFVVVILIPKLQWKIFHRIKKDEVKPYNLPILVFFTIIIFSFFFLGNFLLKTNIVSAFFDQYSALFGKIEIKNFGYVVLQNTITFGDDCRELRTHTIYDFSTQNFFACYGVFLFICLFTFFTFKKYIPSGNVPVLFYDTFLVCVLSYPILLYLANFALCDQRAWVKTRFLEIPFYLIIFAFFFALFQLKSKYLIFYRIMVLGVMVYMIGPVWGTGRLEQIFNNGKAFLNSQYVNGHFLFHPTLANLNGIGKKEAILCDPETGNLEVLIATKDYHPITKKLNQFTDTSLCNDIQAVDLNKDGKDDLVFRSGAFIKMIAVSSSYQEDFRLTLFPLDLEGDPLLFQDLNGDTIPDLVFFSNTSNEEIKIEVKLGASEKSSSWGTFKARAENLIFEDINQDGKLDLVNKNQWIAFSTGYGLDSPLLLNTSHHLHVQNIFFKNLNEDNVKDILYLTKETGKEIKLWEIPSKGDKFGNPAPLVTIPNEIHIDYLEILDLNGDGNKDIIFFDFSTKSGRVRWPEFNASNLYTSFWSNGEYHSPRKLAEFQGFGTPSMFHFHKFADRKVKDIVFRDSNYRIFTTNLNENTLDISPTLQEWGKNDHLLYFNIYDSENSTVEQMQENTESRLNIYRSKVLSNIDQIYFKDINGDNQEDILYIDHLSSPGFSKFFLSLYNNGNFSKARLRLNHAKQRDGFYELGTLNQDGTLDISYNFYNRNDANSFPQRYTKKLIINKTFEASTKRTSEDDVVWEKIKQAIHIKQAAFPVWKEIVPSFGIIRKNGNVKLDVIHKEIPLLNLSDNKYSKYFHYEDVSGDMQKDLIYIDLFSNPKITKVYVSIKEDERFLPATVWLTVGTSAPDMFTFGDYNKDGKIDLQYYDRYRSNKKYRSFSDPESARFTSPEKQSPCKEDVVWKRIKQVIPIKKAAFPLWKKIVPAMGQIVINETGNLDFIHKGESQMNLSDDPQIKHIFHYDINDIFHYEDVTGDMQKDLIYIDLFSNPKITKVYVSIKEDERFLPATVWLTVGASAPDMFTFGDYNHDCKIDVRYHDRYRSKRYYRSFSDPESARFTEPELQS